MKPDRSAFQELIKHQGTINYEVIEIIPSQNDASYFEMDTVSRYLYVDSFFEPKSKKREEMELNTLKLDFRGNQLDNYETHNILKDGTMWDMRYYVNAIVNGDTMKKKYIDPFSLESIDNTFKFEIKEDNPKEWLEKFTEFYENASYVHEESWNYYFKIDEKWYLIKYNLEVVNGAFVKNHPPKNDAGVRMLKLESLTPRFSITPEERDTTLIKEIAYESDYEEEVDKGIFSYGYSAGWWYLEIYMPSGDTIPIKRYSEFKSPNLELYKVPVEHGGREDVLFIIQKPEPTFPEQVGGMYVIRPRNPQ